MVRGDEFLYAVTVGAVLRSLTHPADIGYRQDVLRDCLSEIYDLTVAGCRSLPPERRDHSVTGRVEVECEVERIEAEARCRRP